MKTIFLFFAMQIATLYLFAQSSSKVYLNGRVYITSTGKVFITGDVVASAAASLVNNGTLALASAGMATSWIDNHGGTGVMSLASTGTTKFVGPNALTIAGTTTTHFHHVTMDNAGGVSLAKDVAIEGVLTFVNGIITTNVNKVIIASPATSAVVADVTNQNYAVGFVNGNLRRSMQSPANGSFDFPVGTATTSNLLIMQANAISGGGFSYLDARFETPKPGTDVGLVATEPSGGVYTQVFSYGVWHIVSNATPTAGTFDVKFYLSGFTGLVDNSFAPLWRIDASSNAADWHAPVGTTLNPFGTAGRIVSANYAARNAIPVSKFGQWGIGQSGSVLSSELVAFSGKEDADVNELYWQTASEYNVREFELEKSADAKLFLWVATVPAKNIFTGSTYIVVDDNPCALSYYRLKISNNDNMVEYSDIIPVAHTAKNTITLFENPSMENPVVVIRGQQASGYDSQLFSTHGVLLPWNENVPSGIYFVVVTNMQTDDKTVLKFIKTN